MAVFPAYESYRSADISWLASVPSHWRATRLKQEAHIQTGITLGKAYAAEVESRPYLRVANVQAGFLDLRHIKYIGVPRSEALKTELRPNDVVLTEGGDIDKLGRGAIWSGQIKGCIHQNHIFAVRPDPTSLSPKFLTYILESPHGRSYFQVTAKQTTNLAATNRSTLGRLPLFLPPRAEQDQIVAYLRAQDAHIARFIQAKRELIKLLTEQKLRIIDQAVTRGLDPNARFKDSGVEWLGEVPEHWELRRLKFLASNTTNQTTTKASDEIYLALEHVQSWTGVARPLEGEVEFASTVKRFVADDVLFGKLRPYLAKVTRAHRAGVCVSEFLVLRSRKEMILPAYLEQLLRCKRVIDLINSSTAGAKMPRADWNFIGNVWLPIPRQDEQEAILSHILRETKDLDEVITRTEEEIKLIREYRDRLIADVVTGQIDVRGWRPGPDDVASDEELAALGDDDEDEDADNSDIEATGEDA
jgi:type I restriction enzyme S subunit